MRTNIDIDEALINEAMPALGTKTKRDTVIEALRRTIRARRQLMRCAVSTGWAGTAI